MWTCSRYTYLTNMLEISAKLAVGILLSKILALSPLTSLFRFKTGQFASAEDTKSNKKWKLGQSAMSIVRIRNAQRNDLENVFIAILLFTIAPENSICSCAYTIFTIFRILHTICYIFALQPFRAISYITSHIVNVYMIFQVYTKSDDQFTKFSRAKKFRKDSLKSTLMERFLKRRRVESG